MLKLTVVAFTIMIVAAVHISSGQCVTGDLTANAVRGQAFEVSRNNKKKRKFPGASVQLLRETKGDKIVVVAGLTDSNGLFAFPNISPGEYILRAFAPNFDDVEIGLTVTRRIQPEKASFIIIRFGATDHSSTDSCWSNMKVEKK